MTTQVGPAPGDPDRETGQPIGGKSQDSPPGDHGPHHRTEVARTAGRRFGSASRRPASAAVATTWRAEVHYAEQWTVGWSIAGVVGVSSLNGYAATIGRKLGSVPTPSPWRERLAVLRSGGQAQPSPPKDRALSPVAEHRVGMKRISHTTEAKTTEEPGPVVPHAGTFVGGCWVTGVPTAVVPTAMKQVTHVLHC